jgi:hypothetical protein
MTFTDEDLKKLRAIAFDGRWPVNELGTISFEVNDLRALLSRLEAAEQVVFDFTTKDVIHHLQKEADIEAWREACGK